MSEGKEKRRQQRTSQSILGQAGTTADEGQVWEKTEANGRGQMETAEDILGKPKTTEGQRAEDRDRQRQGQTRTTEDRRGHFRTLEGR